VVVCGLFGIKLRVSRTKAKIKDDKKRAYQHGGYSAIPQSVVIGTEGGQVLVEETLKISDGMFVK